MEIAWAEVHEARVRAHGTQLGAAYELRYAIDGELLRVTVDGRSLDIRLDADFFDLGFSPLFNSLPVIRYGLHRSGEPRDFVMTWVSVPDLSVSRSEQRYEPIRPGLVRFRSGTFEAEIEFDDEGFVVTYPGLAERVEPPEEDHP
jgi:hypothetical protein